MTYIEHWRVWEEGCIKRRLGIPIKMPLEFSGRFKDQETGLTFVVRAQIKPGRRKHRVFAICDDCDRYVPAGRMHQHKCS